MVEIDGKRLCWGFAVAGATLFSVWSYLLALIESLTIAFPISRAPEVSEFWGHFFFFGRFGAFLVIFSCGCDYG